VKALSSRLDASAGITSAKRRAEVDLLALAAEAAHFDVEASGRP
jgi:hypothetical protein